MPVQSLACQERCSVSSSFLGNPRSQECRMDTRPHIGMKTGWRGGGQCGGTKLSENYIVKVFGVSPSTVLVVLLTCSSHLIGFVLPCDFICDEQLYDLVCDYVLLY